MSEKILCVDDEPNILEAYQRALRREFEIEIAVGGEQGLAAVESRGPFAVTVSDMRMPGMDGVQFLSKVKEKAPDSVRIMLTGNADQQTAVEAVNEGNIFRFLTKPCPPEVLGKALTAGIQQYRLVMAEKELLEKTLSGSVQMLSEILSLVNPTAFGRATRVRRLASKLAAVLKIDNAWQTEIAAALSQIGCITLPEETLTKVYQGKALRPEELQMWQNHPQIARDLLLRIPRLEPVAEIIAYQEKRYNGQGLPSDDRHGQSIPLGARILKLTLDFDKLMEGGFSHTAAVEEIQRRGDWYDYYVVEALKKVLSEEVTHASRMIGVEQLALNMILDQDVISVKGLLLIPKGHEVTNSLLMRLNNFYQGGAISGPIKVLLPVKKEEN